MLTNLLISWGLTRDSWVWFWGQLVTVAVLITSETVVDLNQYFGPKEVHTIKAVCVVILLLSGRYNSSSLPAKKVQ